MAKDGERMAHETDHGAHPETARPRAGDGDERGPERQGASPEDAGGAAAQAAEAAPLSPEEEVLALREELAQAKEQALRARAELENVRKRLQRELVEEREYAASSALQDVLPAIDSFDLTLEAARRGAGDPAALLKGVEMVRDQLDRVLTSRGAQRIEAAGKPFDPHLHEAVSVLERSDVEPNTVIHEVRRGYKLKDRVLRPTQVVVSRRPQE